MLMEARDLPDLRDIRDMAEAARAWARAHDLGIEAENNALTIRLTAERRIGELLVKSRADGTRARTGKESYKTTLADIGITKQQSSQWQTLAGMPEERFVAEISGDKVSPTRIYKTARDLARPVPEPIEIADPRYLRSLGNHTILEVEDGTIDLANAWITPEWANGDDLVEMGRWVSPLLKEDGILALWCIDPTDVGRFVIYLNESMDFRNVVLNYHEGHWGLILLFGGRTPDTSKPLDASEGDVRDQLLEMLTEEGDTVLDLFGGSDMAQAAIRNRRSYIGAFEDERDLRDADAAVARYL